MRVVPLLVVAAWTLSSCTTIVVGDTHVWGRTKDVSVEDIRAALAVAAAAQLSNGNAPEAQVISRDEIHVFFERGGRLLRSREAHPRKMAAGWLRSYNLLTQSV
jgi:hypothetical protein